ncbi:MAG: CPBP family intramembrane metalloprotease [Dehalococcoidia bacterium]|nr:CPBP family intramembrane metalloprotease [Dehalococcoidia bacterium]
MALAERLSSADLGVLKQGNGISDLPTSTSLVWFILGFTVMAIAPLSEELFFRGFLFRAVQGRAGLVAGLLVSALAFAAFHLNVGVLLPFFAVGLIFAWAYHASGSLWTPIAAHTIFNSIAFIATLAGVSP